MGKTNHPKKIEKPAKTIKISNKIPIIIKKHLKIVPKIRKIKFEKNASKYFPISNPLPYDHLYLRQGEKNVLIKRETEK